MGLSRTELFAAIRRDKRLDPELSQRASACEIPRRELFALSATVRHDQTGALIAAVGNRHRVAVGSFDAGLVALLGVVPVAGQWPANHDAATSLGVDDHVMSGGILIVLRLLGNRVVASGPLTSRSAAAWTGHARITAA